MEPFVRHRGKLAVLDWADVNTDLIMPARYLTRIERDGYGPLLFADKRYTTGTAPPADAPAKVGTLDPSFPLNQDAARAATILLVGRNFGTGSSREHAVWGLLQGGFRALIAPGLGTGFADIFKSNAKNNGLPPIEVPAQTWSALVDLAKSNPGTEATIDLEAETITVHLADEQVFPFTMPDADRRRLQLGLDPIAETLEKHEAAIRSYEAQAAALLTPASS